MGTWTWVLVVTMWMIPRLSQRRLRKKLLPGDCRFVQSHIHICLTYIQRNPFQTSHHISSLSTYLHSIQTIRNDDLEEIRELGSGTYGSVYHGKWKGSDVAIKRIKASCFAGRPSERERLVHYSYQHTFFYLLGFTLLQMFFLSYIIFSKCESRYLVLNLLSCTTLNINFFNHY